MVTLRAAALGTDRNTPAHRNICKLATSLTHRAQSPSTGHSRRVASSATVRRHPCVPTPTLCRPWLSGAITNGYRLYLRVSRPVKTAYCIDDIAAKAGGHPAGWRMCAALAEPTQLNKHMCFCRFCTSDRFKHDHNWPNNR